MEIWRWIVGYWQFLAGTAIGIAIAVWTVIYQRQPKHLDWELRSDIQLVNPETRELRERLELRFNAIPIEDPRVVVIRIQNTGKKAVSAPDYEVGKPVTIAYARHAPIDIQVIRTSDGLSRNDVHVTQQVGVDAIPFGEVEIVPRLLNPGEWFDVQLLSDYDHGEIDVTARFADQKRDMRRLDSRDRSPARSA